MNLPAKDRERLPIHKGLPINYMILKDLFVRIQRITQAFESKLENIGSVPTIAGNLGAMGSRSSPLIVHGSSGSTWIASTFELK